VREGDVILHNGSLVFIEDITPDKGRFYVVNPVEGTGYTVLPQISPLGYDYLVCILNIMENLPAADAANPFGSYLPLLLAGKDNNNMALMLALSGKLDTIDPMMLALMGNGDISTYLLMNMLNKKTEKE
jgi:hypothetical protein